MATGAVGVLLAATISVPTVLAQAQPAKVHAGIARPTATSGPKLKPCKSSTGSTAKCGTLKICKVAGFGVAVGTAFTFTVPTSSGIVTVTVPAGPAPGGFCTVVGTYATGAFETTEVIPAGDSVTSITGVPTGAANLGAGTFRGNLRTGLVSEVTYTNVVTQANQESGYLEICKQVPASPVAPPAFFVFTVNGQTVVVPTGACSPAMQLTSGSQTVTETPISPYVMSACSTIPAANLLSCNTSGDSATVTIDPGSVSAETILTVTNSQPVGTQPT